MRMPNLRRWAKALKLQTLVVYFAARDPRTPRLVRVLALGIAAYALSPIDLIPDFIPVLGLLDDLVIVPLGLMMVLRLIPADVLATSQARARSSANKPVSRMAAAVIVVVWLILAVALGFWAWRAMHAA